MLGLGPVATSSHVGSFLGTARALSQKEIENIALFPIQNKESVHALLAGKKVGTFVLWSNPEDKEQIAWLGQGGNVENFKLENSLLFNCLDKRVPITMDKALVFLFANIGIKEIYHIPYNHKTDCYMPDCSKKYEVSAVNKSAPSRHSSVSLEEPVTVGAAGGSGRGNVTYTDD